MIPWNDPDFGHMMAIHMLQRLGYDAERQQRIESEMVSDALRRCGFQAVPVKKTPFTDEKPTIELRNAAGVELNTEEKQQLEQMYATVKAEYKQRAEEAKAARERERQAEEARRKAEYDAAAAPFREARRLKYQKRFEAEQARKAKA